MAGQVQLDIQWRVQDFVLQMADALRKHILHSLPPLLYFAASFHHARVRVFHSRLVASPGSASVLRQQQEIFVLPRARSENDKQQQTSSL
jgi:hypothetical protein